MDAKKKKRLEAAGWRVGSTAEFLGLSETESERLDISKATMRKEYDLSNAKRGAVLFVPPGKTRITIRLDDDVIAWFHKRVNDAGGGNYHTLINLALRQLVNVPAESIEDTLRRVIREELQRLAPVRRRKKTDSAKVPTRSGRPA